MLAFLERRSLAVAMLLLVFGALRIVSTYTELGVTFDEPAHVAAGVEYLSRHLYRYETQHPPLARVMAAIGPYLAGARTTGISNMYLEGAAEIYHCGKPARNLALARLGPLPFFFLAGLVVYGFARDLAGRAAASLATGLFTMLPPVLAHGGLATTDMALAACLGAAFYALYFWAGSPTLKHSVLFGLATAAAAVSKFTSLGYLPIAAALVLALHIWIDRPGLSGLAGRARALAGPFTLAVFTGALAIWAVYRFSFGPVSSWPVPLPAPEFFDGIRGALGHYRTGNSEYFLGRISSTGWWYFFPVVLAVKTPVAFLVLLGYGCIVCWKMWMRACSRWALGFALGILAAAMTSSVDLGVRHILPVYIGFAIVAGLGLADLLGRGAGWKPAGTAALALVVWMAATGAAIHPDYLAYFNFIAGSEPEKILVDSDLDWGQETKRLADRLRELGVREVGFEAMNFDDDQLAKWPGMPRTHLIDPLVPTEGWTAVSPTFWKVGQYGLEHKYPNLKPWFEKLKPVERVGSLLLYYVPPGSLRRRG